MRRTTRTCWAIVAMVLGASVLTSCGDADSGADPGPGSDGIGADLTDREFLSQSVEGRALVPETQIRLGFPEGRLSANAGCNTTGGTFSIEDGQLVAEDLFTTLMGCDAPLMEQDDWFKSLLEARPRVTLDGNRLVLSGDTVTVRLLDRREADPDRPLIGTTWTVDTVVSRGGASSVPSGSVVTIVVRDDGTIAVTSEGCGATEAGVEVDEPATELRVASLPDETADCPSPWGETLGLLRSGSVTYEIVAGRLTLSVGDTGVSATAGTG